MYNQPYYQRPQQQFKKQVLIQLKDVLVEDVFPLEELIYNGVLTKYKEKTGTENIVIISQYGNLVNKHETFAHLTSFEQPLLNIFNVPDILKLNEMYHQQSNLEKAKEQFNFEKAKEQSIISQEIEQKYQNKIKELEAQIQQLRTIIQSQKDTICKLENQVQCASYESEILSNPLISTGKKLEIVQVESSLSIDQQRVIKSRDYIEQIIQTKNKQIKILELRSSKLYDSSSSMSDQEYCQFCNQQIDQDCLKLSCQHNYHDECFDTLLQGQLTQEECRFQCLCCVKLKPKEVLSLQNEQAAQVYQLQMHLKQLKSLKNKMQNVKQCGKKFCSFFYIHDPKYEGQYCPLCLQ